jgi:tetratricopeptide (TPR) repeat protein
MKTSVVLFLVACGVIAGAIVLLNHTKTSPAPAPAAEAAPKPAEPPPESVSVPKPEAPEPHPINTVQPAPVAIATPAATETNATASTNAISKAVDALLTAKDGAKKHDLFEQLRQSGQLEQAIAELQQRANANPTDVEIRTTLGEAQLNQIRVLKESGADNDQLGILAMQADQNFNAALKTDPQNWEAQFVKAASMVYWPPDPTRDASVVKLLSGLIDQQDTMPAQPEFAQSYGALAKEYEKLGKHDEAQATLILGLQKFPGDPTLLKIKNGQ